MRRTFSFLMVLLFTLTVSAQSDFDVAQKFMVKKGVTLVDNPRTRAVSEKYSIFNGNDGKGFAIVANGSIIGYSTEDVCDPNNLPPQLKEMLDSLPKVERTRGAVEGRVYPEGFEVRDVTPIKPMITTKWGQNQPYKKYLEWVSGGICGFTADAQILHYYKVPCTYIDFEHENNNNEFLPKTTFNHDKMLDVYEEGNYTEEEAEEVAKFFHYMLGMSWPNPSVDIFHSKYFSKYASSPMYEKIGCYVAIDSCLETKNPVNIVGRNLSMGCHAFIIDGRDEDGLYHVNWGWDGRSDGYYAFATTRDKHQELQRATGSTLLAQFTVSCVDLFVMNISSSTSIANTPLGKSTDDGVIYNLQGQRIEGKPSRGIYIRNGRKYVVK